VMLLSFGLYQGWVGLKEIRVGFQIESLQIWTDRVSFEKRPGFWKQDSSLVLTLCDFWLTIFKYSLMKLNIHLYIN